MQLCIAPPLNLSILLIIIDMNLKLKKALKQSNKIILEANKLLKEFNLNYNETLLKTKNLIKIYKNENKNN